MNALQEELDKINEMTQIEMARLYRFAPSGHAYFITGTPLQVAFNTRFKRLGAFTPEISRAIG